MLSLPLLRSCLVCVPSLASRGTQQPEPGGMGRKAALPRLGFYHKLRQATEPAARQSRRPLRSGGRMLRFPLCPFPSWQGPGSAPCDLQNLPSRGRGLPLWDPRLSCPTGTTGFPRWGSPKLLADLEGREEALGKFTGKISGLNLAVWDGECLKTVLPMRSPA